MGFLRKSAAPRHRDKSTGSEKALIRGGGGGKRQAPPALLGSVESRSLHSPVTVAVIGIVCTLVFVISANEWAPTQTAAPP